MTEAVPEKSILEELKQDLANFCAQRDSFQTNLQQCLGAIYATEIAIKKLEAKEAPKEPEQSIELELEAAP